MRYRNVGKWHNFSQMRGMLFFVQRLDELTFSYTLDSYKSPTTCLQGLIAEAASTLSKAESNDKYYSAAEHIVDEIKMRLKGNFIAKRICSIDTDKLLSIDKIEKDRSVRNLRILHAELDVEQYIAEIVDELISLARDERRKRDIDFLAREFVSVLQYLGVSREHINKTAVDFFFEQGKLETDNDFKEFCKLVYPHHHKYCALIGAPAIVSSFGESILAFYKIGFPDDHEEIFDSDEVSKYLEKTESESAFLVFTEATDYNSALSESLAQLESAYNQYRLFSHKDKFSFASSAIIVQACCDGIKKHVNAPVNNMQFIKDLIPEKAAESLRRYSKDIRLDVGRDARKFNNIVNIHGMSLSSHNCDVQIVNLWTCLETISPSDDSSSKISNVINRIIPIIILGYFKRLLANLLRDILRWNRHAFNDSLQRALSLPSRDLTHKLFSLLTRTENTTALEYLLAKCGDFELLRFRIYSLHKLFTSPQIVKDTLDRHEKMVRWQFHRIYRTRNSIVHSGESPKFTRYLVENAHDYFDQSMLFCLELSSWKAGYDTFASCFDFAGEHYRQYTKNINAGDISGIIWELPDRKGKSLIFQEEA